MKSRIFKPEVAEVFAFSTLAQIRRKDARPRMWIKRQFFTLRLRFNSQRICMKQQCFAQKERARPRFAISLEYSREGLRTGLVSEAFASSVIPGRA
ncbi:hypothetical protein IVA80_11310 [Bradyrhizobium sp. 139]|uniref:hypothetical protein n=1 Tax=Bradyrhizobium sp. 139 TaxID=2782616 RepID=UPI001FF7E5AD|nr:hypothetical protein [Bradyrhizobium sp. 139]MCK1741439.1 hypothetical protein [Bradyrhizobium sp. 139]